MKVKKLVAALLIICMALSLTPTFALAAQGDSAVTPPAEGWGAETLGEYLDVKLAQNAAGKVINGGDEQRVKDNPHAQTDTVATQTQKRDLYNMITNFGYRGGESDSAGTFVPGFTFSGDGTVNTGYTGGGDDTSGSYEYNGFIINTGRDNPATATITVDNNPTLKAMAESGQLEFRFNGNVVGGYDIYNLGASEDFDDARAIVSVTRSGSTTQLVNKFVRGNSMAELDTGWYSVQPGDVITIYCAAAGDVKGNMPGIGNAGLYFKDTTAPQLVDYAMTTNGSAYYNSSLQRTEILLKQYGVTDATTDSPGALDSTEGYIDMDINFSEGVYSALATYVPASKEFTCGTNESNLLGQLANHKLFTNTSGTGFQNEGQPVDINLVAAYDGQGAAVTIDSTPDNFAASQRTALVDMFSPVKTLSYRWQTEDGAYYGNNPIPGGGDWSGSVTFNNTYSLIDKLYLASLHDAAGNPLVRSNGTPIKVSEIGTQADSILPGSVTLKTNDGNNGTIETRPTSVSPFDEFAFIIDDVPPTYSMTSNGIQPNILTKLTLNKNDTIEFLVNFSESMCLRRYMADGTTALGWLNEETYIEFNNGMKAYYTGGAGTKQWKFEMTVEGLSDEEINALEATALANEGHEADAYVLTDYVGNPLTQAAGNTSNRSSIEWAALGVDNTKPVIGFIYGLSGTEPVAEDGDWGQSAAVTINANDPNTTVDVNLNRTGKGSGIFRILNATGDPVNMTQGGMVYYVWVKGTGDGDDEGDTDDAVDKVVDDLTKNNYAALKLYSLAMTQPEAYAGPATKAGTLQVVNNNTPLTMPDGMTDGKWYLVSFTADMTWDSARQLIQYKKLKGFKLTDEGKAQYLAWFNEYGETEYESLEAALEDKYASYNDAVYSADRKGMEQVGVYKDWTTVDYSADDSNWTWKSTGVFLDTAAPTAEAGEVTGNRTSEATVPVTAADANSGVKEIYGCFVERGEPSAWGTAKTPDALGAAEFKTSDMTLGNGALGNGTFDLWVKVVDNVGLESVIKVKTGVVVDASTTFKYAFSIPSNQGGTAMKNIDGLYIDVGLIKNNAPVDTTVSCVISAEATAPADGYSAMTSTGAGAEIDGAATRRYEINPAGVSDGVKYVHVKVEATDFSQTVFCAYKIDAAAPTVTFSPPQTSFAQENADVSLSVNDSNGGRMLKYMWVEQGGAAPTEVDDSRWTELEGKTTLTITAAGMGIAAGESKSFKLYVWAEDEAGNTAVCASSGLYELTRPKTVAAPSEVSGDLLAISGSAEAGYYGVVDITIGDGDPDPADLVGLRYSAAIVEPGVQSVWSRWLPYESMVSVGLGKNADLSGKQLWVRFRSSTGEVSDEAGYIKITNLAAASDALWATVNRDTFKMIPASGAVKLTLNSTAGAATSLDGEQANISGDDGVYTVTDNGCYTFKVNKGGEEETLSVVVDNFDKERPIGSIRYTTTAPTAANVTAFLTASEDVTVTGIAVSYAGEAPKTVTGDNHQFVFEKNGTAVFSFRDEAGNEASVTASVANIDRIAPDMAVALGYQYTVKSTGYSYGTIKSGVDVVLAQGAVLTVSSADSGVKVTSGTDSPSTFVRRVTENGTYTFVITNALGNVNSKSVTISNIVSSIPTPTAELTGYAYRDNETGDITPADPDDLYTVGGATYAKNKAGSTTLAKVVISGSVEGYANGNRAYDGAAKSVVMNGEETLYSNLIATDNDKGGAAVYANTDGNYTITKYYSANGTITAKVADELGNVAKYSFNVTGLDNSKPTLKFDPKSVVYLNLGTVPTAENLKPLGGYTASDNVTAAGDLTLSVKLPDTFNKDVAGAWDVTYTVTDRSGNSYSLARKVFLIPTDGMLILGRTSADGSPMLFYSASKDAALMDNNTITFEVDRYKLMEFGTTQNADGTWNTESVTNEWATFDIYIQQGAYREGYLKYIQTLKMSELTSDTDKATITLDVNKLTETGVYTIIIRNQEREREFTTFFITYIADN